jgi:DNA-binding transcriptional regulator YhcF (GntR family)
MIISLELDSETPLYEQLFNQIVIGIASGRLAPGERLPAVRQLADELGINMMTVNKAYTLLKQQGYIVIDRRHGAQIRTRFETADALPPSLEKQLSLVIAQAKIHGIGQDRFAAICQRLYSELSESP